MKTLFYLSADEKKYGGGVDLFTLPNSSPGLPGGKGLPGYSGDPVNGETGLGARDETYCGWFFVDVEHTGIGTNGS